MSGGITEAIAVVAMLAKALGVSHINRLPGCWEHAVDGEWWFALNGHEVETKCARGLAVPPFHCYAEYRGMPAMLVSPAGGSVLGYDGECEDAFIAAVQRATEKAAVTP